MKKIHITEAQLEELRKKLTETYNVDVTPDIEAGKTASQIVTDKKSKNPSLSSDISRGEVSFTFNPDGIDEGKAYTKRGIKEAKLKKLQENCVVFKKSDLS